MAQLTNADVCQRLVAMWHRIPQRFRPWRSEIWVEDRGSRIWLTIATPPFRYGQGTIPAAPAGKGLVTCRKCFETFGEHWIAVQMLYAIEQMAGESAMPTDLREFLMGQMVCPNEKELPGGSSPL